MRREDVLASSVGLTLALFGIALTPADAASPPSGAAAQSESARPYTSGAAIGDVDSNEAVDAGVYVVALRDPPVATYSGRLAGYAATAPEPGRRVNSGSASAQSYRALLLQRQQELLADLGAADGGEADLLYSYTTALDGFAARLTASQVKELRSSPEVLAVQADSRVHAQGFPPSRGRSLPATGENNRVVAVEQGRGMVIGVVDSGIWPENPSFAGVPVDRSQVRRDYHGFSGECQVAEHWSPTSCTTKIVSARYFVRGFGRQHIASGEYLSPRDPSGHGSSVASVAAGNDGVVATIDDQHFGRISGAAPDAALAVYKACWTAPDPADDGCSIADTVKAVDQAVADGVDVLDYSLGSATTSPTDVVELAFLNAAEAGVFVAAAAGDGGPAAGSVAHGSPWVTTVAASTSSPYRGGVRLGSGRTLVGSMVSNQFVSRAPLLYAGDAGAPGAARARAARCYPGTLDAATVRGSIVLCDRGDIARVTKSATVSQAGGVAMILANRSADDEPVDVHMVPTVHLDVAEGDAVRRYIESAVNPAARLDPSIDSPHRTRPAGFTARGPSAVGDGDLLKPDLSAPGVGIIGATAPPADFSRLWDLSTGTSSSAPQVAGLAADLMAVHPDWSPAAVKSAMMTTSSPLPGRAAALAGGSGEVVARDVFDPGLVYDAGRADWLQFLEGSGATYGDASPVAMRALDAHDLNVASIAIGRLVADQQVERTVTNVSDRAETYVAQVSGLHGIGVAVTPSTMTLEPGESRRFTVAFTLRRSAHYDQVSSGELSWHGSLGHRVTSPIVIRPEYVLAPDGLLGTGRGGDLRLRAEAGVTGTIATRVLGPVAARPVDLLLEPGRFESTAPRRTRSTFMRSYPVRAHTAALRFEVAAPNSSCDFDLYVYRRSQLVAARTSASADEQVTVEQPSPGRYDVYVNAVTSTSSAACPAQFTGWVLGSQRGRGLTVTPPRVDVTGHEPFVLDVGWTGLEKSRRWFGAVTYADSDSLTFVTIG
ncbi:MAG: S8 family serine peptidase [Nocardioidaceae bacterium]